jgi:lipopolysaccharide/colanic/teichoic acid biosynthesis glycosyltransferase
LSARHFESHSNRNKGIPHLLEKVLALAGLAAFSPLLLISAVLILATSQGPVLFRQERIGRFGKPFTLFKFRSMHIYSRGPQVTAKGDSRVTAIGRLLRKSKVDELPELWNVVRGDLSLVGPRPEVPRYFNPDNPLWQMVLKTRPGITDPVTLQLRNEEELLQNCNSNPEHFYLKTLQPYKLLGYAEYIQRRTWRTDIGVLYRTVLAILLPGRAPHLKMEQIEETVKGMTFGGGTTTQ